MEAVLASNFDNWFAESESLENRVARTLDFFLPLMTDQSEVASSFPSFSSALSAFFDEAVRLNGSHEEVGKIVRGHPIHDALRGDPFTRTGLEKKRGYPGDAELLDFVYRIVELPRDHAASLAAWHIGNAVISAPTCTSARYRLARIGSVLEATLRDKPGARIGSIACGLAREFSLVRHRFLESLGEFTALDHDPRTLDELELAELADRTLKVNHSIGDLLSGDYRLSEGFDLVYSAGLYDYLDDETAVSLTNLLLASLAPKGRLIVVNVTDIAPERGYAEYAMDWRLIYRSRSEFYRVMAKTDSESFAKRFYTDPTSIMAFVEFERL